MTRKMRFAAFILAFILRTPASADDKLVDHLQSISLTVRSGTSSGSGVAFTRKDGAETKTYIWTAGHVVDNLRKQRDIIVGGDKKTVVEFEDASIVTEFHQDGRRIGEMKLDAKVLCYSDADNGEDLAVLEVRRTGFLPAEATVTFYDGEIPKLGTELYHVGSMLGEPNSLTAGILSQVGRVLDLGANGKTFDQCQCTSMPGSSGGGIFLKADGRCIGLLVRGAGEGFGLLVPVRRMRDWAKEAKVEWAMDHNVEMPSARELRELPIEDSSVSPHSGDSHPVSVEFPFLIARPHHLSLQQLSPCDRP